MLNPKKFSRIFGALEIPSIPFILMFYCIFKQLSLELWSLQHRKSFSLIKANFQQMCELRNFRWSLKITFNCIFINPFLGIFYTSKNFRKPSAFGVMLIPKSIENWIQNHLRHQFIKSMESCPSTYFEMFLSLSLTPGTKEASIRQKISDLINMGYQKKRRIEKMTLDIRKKTKRFSTTI